MKKILFLANIPSPYRIDFFNEWGKTCDLTVAFERRDARNRNSNWLMKKAKNFNAIYLNGIKMGEDSGICFDIIRIIKRGDFDLIITGVYSEPTSIILIEYLNLYRIPYVISMDGAIRHRENNYKTYLKRHLFKNCIGFLSSSKECDKYIRRYKKNAKIYRYPFTSVLEKDLIPNIISLDEKLKIKERLGIPYNKVVLSVGQFIHRKGMDILIQSAKHLDENIGIYIVGGEPTVEYIKLATKTSNNIHFVGFMGKKELAQYYKAADVFALATREDIWGLVINEAMAYGLPVICTNMCISGVELIEQGVNGYIINIDDPIELAEKIKEVINSDDIEHMQQRCLEIIKQYTIERMAIVHNQIVEKILKGD